MKKGLKLKREGLNPADIFLEEDGNLAICEGAEAIGQHARQRLLTFEGEWFLDKTSGVPWLSDLLGKSYDPSLAESVIKAELLETDGVEEITSFSVRFDRSVRQLSAFDIDVTTEYDEEISL